MADETPDNIEGEPIEEVDLDEVDKSINKKNKVEERIKDLSHKVKTTAEERDELQKLTKQLEEERDEAKREAEFYTSLSTVTDKYPDAREYKDDILEKVKSGYSIEDAAIAILVKEGKYTAPGAGETTKETPPSVDETAGGSATNVPQMGEKTIKEVIQDGTQEEKRAALVEEEKKGNLGLS